MTISLGALLDTAIGLALIYLLLGMIASAVQETCAAVLKWRGRQLRDGIKALLAGTAPVTGTAKDVAERVFGHPLVQGINVKGLPSYVPARNFATALFAVLIDGSQAPVFSQLERGIADLPADMPAKQSLTALVQQAGGDLDKLQSSVQTWYADAMDRLSGDYKRWSQYFALAFGIIVAVVCNVDTFAMTHRLMTDDTARSALTAVATQYVATHPAPAGAAGTTPNAAASAAPASQTAATGTPDPAAEAADLTARIKTANDALDSLPVITGWQIDKQHPTVLSAVCAKLFDQSGSGILVVLGWLATGLAVSLGAPFWFDTLSMLINLRGSGPKPANPPQQNPASATSN